MKRGWLIGGAAGLAALSVIGSAFAQDATPAPAADPAPLPAALVGNVEAGEELFVKECRACHAGAIAPNLRGVAGRKVASVSSFFGYSKGLKAKADQTWTDENLDIYLKAPSAFVPGSAMVFAVPDPQKRADVIAFLKTFAATE